MPQQPRATVPGAYDVIIVLGASVWPGGKPSETMRRRVAHAVQLMQRGVAPMLVLTGGLGRYPPAEAVVMQQLAVLQGLSTACLLLEDQAACTFDSAVLCTALLRQHGWQRALVVTDRYHMPRTLLAFWSCGTYARGSAAPRPPARRWRRRWASYLREIPATLWYGWRALAWRLGFGRGAVPRRSTDHRRKDKHR